MIKKFVSNALLSVVMDKDARKKLESIRASESNEKAPRKPSSDNKSRSPVTNTITKRNEDNGGRGEDVIDTIAQALAEARAEVEKSSHTGPRTGTKPGSRAPRNTQQRSAPSPSAPPSRPPSPSSPAPAAPKKAPASTAERERLIQEAMSIQRKQSHVLEDLDPAMREKLMVMAQYVMDPSSLPPGARNQAKADARTEGLVDDPGAKAGSKRKKPLPPRK